MELSVICEPDALIRLGRRKDGKWAWAPVDVKWHRTLEGSSKAVVQRCSTLKAPHPDQAKDTDLGVGVPHRSDAMQLAHYRVALEHYGYAAELAEGEHMFGAIIGKEGLVTWVDLDEPRYTVSDRNGRRVRKSASEIYLSEFAFRLKVIELAKQANDNPSVAALTLPEWKSECKECPWQIVCHDELKFDLGHHITLLPGMTPARAKNHYAEGVTSAVKLARLDYPTAVGVDHGVNLSHLAEFATDTGAEPDLTLSEVVNLAADTVVALDSAGFVTVADLARVHAPTAAYANGKVTRLGEAIDQARVALAERVHRARGVAFVDIPRAIIEEDVDIEDANGRCYLIGVLDTGMKKKFGNRKMRREYYAFVDWTGTDEGEARIFAEWWAHVLRMQSYGRDNHYSFRVYHYSDHETRYFRSLAIKHAGVRGVPTSEELEVFFAGKAWVDLYPIVTKQLVWPTEDLTLKSLAKYVKFFWRDEAPGGGNSIAWYQEAIQPDSVVTDDGVDAREDARTRLLQYNEDDVLATWTIRDWISRLGEARRPGHKLPSVEDLDTRFRWLQR
jgi:predicted RecB family nuclease